MWTRKVEVWHQAREHQSASDMMQRSHMLTICMRKWQTHTQTAQTKQRTPTAQTKETQTTTGHTRKRESLTAFSGRVRQVNWTRKCWRQIFQARFSGTLTYVSMYKI